MSTKHIRPSLEPAKYIRNGKYPDALMQADIADLASHIARYRMKEIASFGMTTSVIAHPSTQSDRVRWRTRYRASPYVTGVYALAWLAQSEPGTPEEFEPYLGTYAVVEFAAGGSATFQTNAATEDNANPNRCAVLQGWMLSGSFIWEPTADTLYDVVVYDVNSRIAALTLYEVRSETGPHDAGYAVGVPILDSQRENLITSARLMWKQQAAPLFTWSVDDQGSPRSTTSSTAKNLVDNSSTSVSGATPGYTIDLRNRSTLSRTGGPCVLEAYGSSTDTGYVRLKDSTGTILATVEIDSATPGWFTTTVDLPATLAKYDLHYDSTSLETTEVGAVVLRQYASGS